MNIEKQLADCACGDCADCTIAKLKAENKELRLNLVNLRALYGHCFFEARRLMAQDAFELLRESVDRLREGLEKHAANEPVN